MPIFCQKLAKIAENCDHNIDPRGVREKIGQTDFCVEINT
jgi:hypothetical protein